MDSFNHPIPYAARRTLARLGGGIEFSERYPNGNIDLSESNVTDQDLSHLVFYPGVASLHLARTGISDQGVRFVGEMRNIESLSLHATAITNDAMAHLGHLLKLEELFIGTDPG